MFSLLPSVIKETIFKGSLWDDRNLEGKIGPGVRWFEDWEKDGVCCGQVGRVGLGCWPQSSTQDGPIWDPANPQQDEVILGLPRTPTPRPAPGRASSVSQGLCGNRSGSLWGLGLIFPQ